MKEVAFFLFLFLLLFFFPFAVFEGGVVEGQLEVKGLGKRGHGSIIGRQQRRGHLENQAQRPDGCYP